MGVSIPAAARALGISPVALRKAIDHGRVVPELDGTLDIEKARAEWLANTHPGQGAPKDAAAANGTSATNQGYRQARLAREFLDVKIKELEFKRLTGELVPRAEVDRVMFSKARAARDRLNLIEARLSPQVAGLTDISEIRRLIRAEIQAVCDELGEVREPPSDPVA